MKCTLTLSKDESDASVQTCVEDLGVYFAVH